MTRGWTEQANHVAAAQWCGLQQQLPFATVLMDSWYATQSLMAQIDPAKKRCITAPSKRTGESMIAVAPRHQRIDELVPNLQQGKHIKFEGFQDKKVKLFRVTVSTNGTEFVITTYLKLQPMQQTCVRYPLED